MNKYSSGYALMQMLSLLGVIVIVCSVGLGIFIFAMNDRLSEFVGITAIIYGGFSGLVLMGMGAIGGAILDGSVSQQRTEQVQSGIKNELSKLIEEFRKIQSVEGSVSNNKSLQETSSDLNSNVEKFKGFEIKKSGEIFFIKEFDRYFQSALDAKKFISNFGQDLEKKSEDIYVYCGRDIKRKDSYYFVEGFEVSFDYLDKAMEWADTKFSLKRD